MMRLLPAKEDKIGQLIIPLLLCLALLVVTTVLAGPEGALAILLLILVAVVCLVIIALSVRGQREAALLDKEPPPQALVPLYRLLNLQDIMAIHMCLGGSGIRYHIENEEYVRACGSLNYIAHDEITTLMVEFARMPEAKLLIDRLPAPGFLV